MTIHDGERAKGIIPALGEKSVIISRLDDLIQPNERMRVLARHTYKFGSCTGGKLFDIAEAAKAIKGRHIASGVSLFVVPASQEIRQKAEELGYLQILAQAGAQILKSGCGACINAGLGVLEKEETGVYAINRNFKGRSGDASAKNYLASPRIVAISAVRGKITDKL